MFLTIVDEEHVPHTAATAMTCFQRLGLTDAGISHLVRNRYPVLTVDLDLYLHLAHEGVDVVNFNHVRDHGWR